MHPKKAGMEALLMVVVVGLLGSGGVTADEGKNADSVQDPIGDKAKLFVQSYSTTTWTFLSSFTSTVPFTCYFTQDATAQKPKVCMGRRLHRARMLTFPQDNTDMDDLLSSGGGAGDDDLKKAVEEEEEAQAEGIKKDKFFFTVWKTSSTTVTITTFSTNRSISLSASVMCTYAGIVYNACA